VRRLADALLDMALLALVFACVGCIWWMIGSL